MDREHFIRFKFIRIISVFLKSEVGVNFDLRLLQIIIHDFAKTLVTKNSGIFQLD